MGTNESSEEENEMMAFELPGCSITILTLGHNTSQERNKMFLCKMGQELFVHLAGTSKLQFPVNQRLKCDPPVSGKFENANFFA